MASTQLHYAAHADLETPKKKSSLQRHQRKGVSYKKGVSGKRKGAAGTIYHAEASDEEEQSNEEEEGNGDVDEDVVDDEDDEPEVMAPSRGIGSVEKKIHADRIRNGDSHHHGAGLSDGNMLAVPVNSTKKRRFSNLSSSSILEASDDDIRSPLNFPRKKKHRALSNDSNGLLTYHSVRQSTIYSDIPDIAVASSDDDEDDDDDDIYQAVNLISDDEEDDPEVEKVEEEVIMSTEATFGQDALTSLSSDIFDELPGNIFGTPDRPLGQLSEISFDHAIRNSDIGKGPDTRKYSTGSTKRVRFWDEQSADGDSSSTSSDLDAMFPDIFAEQDRLPPMLQHLIENDTDGEFNNPSGSDGEHSYWDFSENDQTSPSQAPGDEDIDDNDDVASSGYDSDEGETTDEECPPPATIRSAKTLLHRSSSSDSDRAVNIRRPFRRSVVKSSKTRGPRWGHFSVDPSKATAFTDRTGRRVIVHPPQIPNAHSRLFPESSASSTANNSPCTSLIATPGEESDFGELTPQNVTNPRDIMFGGLFGMPQDVGNLLKGQVIGPPEAFFPFVALDSNGNPIDEMDEYSEYEDEMDDDIDLENFLALPEGMEENVFETPSQPPVESDATAGHSDDPETTPVARTRTFGETMLDHFDRTPGVVASFRSNQDKYRKIAGEHPNPDLRSSNSQAVRFGKSAETPITPMRKRSSASRRQSSHAESPLQRHSSSSQRHSGPRMGTFS